MRVLIVADSDTRWKWAYLVARALGAPPEQTTGVLIDNATVPSERQLAEVGADVPRILVEPIDELRSSPLLAEHDVMVLGLTGGGIFALTRAAAALPPTERPVVVTGYVGLVYEKELEGFLWRIGADVICMNSQRDVERFSGYSRDLGVDPSVLVRSGIPLVPDRIPVEPRPVGTLTFVVQPDVPKTKEARLTLLGGLHEYALRYPDRRVIVKLRSRPDENTTHPEPFHYEMLFQATGQDRPPNLVFAYGNMADVLTETDLCVTISSTAALEALSRGIPTAILTDYGVREALGNHIFLGSGCLVPFVDLLEDRVPTPRADWLAENGLSDDDDVANVASRVKELLELRDTEPGGLPAPERWVTAERAPMLLKAHEDQWFAPREKQVAPTGPKAALKRQVRRVIRGPVTRINRKVLRWTNS